MTTRSLRRWILRTAVSVTILASVRTLVLPLRAASAGVAASRVPTAVLANALRLIGGDVCIGAAARLEALSGRAERFSLHLRQSGLNQADTKLLADALGSLKSVKHTVISSLSVSLNPEIGDAGATAIANALPLTLPELGMVGCNMGDQAGESLLYWAHAAPNLHTMCIEQNRFSARLKVRFTELAKERPNILLTV